MKVAFASDDRTSLTDFLIRDLEQRNYEVLRFGSIADGDTEIDWPQSSRNAAEAVARGDAQEGIAVARPGTGASTPPPRWWGFAPRFAPMPNRKGARIWNDAKYWRSACDPPQRRLRRRYSTPGTARPFRG